MRKLVRTCSYDFNSVSVFDADRKNEFGEMYCAASGVLYSKNPQYALGSEWEWNNYVTQESRI